MYLAIRVTVPGLSGLTNAYTSVLSATGSLEISGASRCDDIYLPHWLERARMGVNRWGSPDRPDDPGGQVLVAQAGLAGPGEHLDVPGPRVADVHHDRSRWRCLQVTAGGCLHVT